MDPNAALAEIRQLVSLSQLLTPDQVERLAELIAGLDGWLSSGGFLPSAWAR